MGETTDLLTPGPELPPPHCTASHSQFQLETWRLEAAERVRPLGSFRALSLGTWGSPTSKPTGCGGRSASGSDWDKAQKSNPSQAFAES